MTPADPPPPFDPDPEVAARVAATYDLARLHARLFCMTLTAAAAADPDGVRAALAGVFDLAAWDRQARTVRARVQQTMRLAEEALVLVAAVRADFDELERRMDALRYECEARDRDARPATIIPLPERRA